jgi:transcriptional antiterminator RfaH
VVQVPEPVFPCYVFIELADGQRWVPINSTFGVMRLLTRQANGSEYREPAVIADAFIAGLQRCSRHDDKEGWRLEPGTAIRILRGPLIGRTAIVTWSSSERVRFLLNLLNRDLEIELEVEHVVPSEPG